MLTLGQNKFLVPAPSGMRSFALQQRIVPVAGRVAGVFLALLDKGADIVSLADMDVVKVLPSALPHIGHIFSEMPPGELEWITRELLRDAKFSPNENTAPSLPLFANSGDAFDALMAGRTTDVWRLLWHALEVWYPDFFARVRALSARTVAVASPSVASSTSPTSGQVAA
jgi:hypothetical protein